MTSPQSRTRLALFGAGAIGRTHIDRIQRNPLLALAGIADPSDAARDLAGTLGVPWFADHRSLLDATRPQGAVVATPNPLHVPMALDCLERGVAALVEKPVTDALDAGLALVAAQHRTGVPVLVGQHRRYNPINRRARALVQDGALGRVVTANVMSTILKPDPYFDVAWRREPGGGPILINLIHEIDQLRFIVGDITSVQAMKSHAVRGFAVEDTAAVTVGFANGALGTLVLSDTVTSPWCWDFCAGEQEQYPRQSVQSHFIGGTHGSLSLPDLALWTYRGERSWHAEMTREQTSLHRVDPYTAQLEHFAAVIAGTESPVCDALDGLKTLQATLAVGQAAAAGTRIELPPLEVTP